MVDESMEILDNGELIIHTTRWGTYQARDKEGNSLCSGPFKEDVIFWGREHLNGFQNSWMSVTSTSFSDGYKL